MTSLADIVLAFHFGIALFITLGLLLIPLGFIYSWSWIRNRRFRQIHAGLMLFVAIEAVFAITCPLTLFWAYTPEGLDIHRVLGIGVYGQRGQHAYWGSQTE
ncbi:MAG: DUF2784 family protein [Burkholderiaceae bacterium]|nr:DUF2784 family protein [Burkholderiaceae bacterium]